MTETRTGGILKFCYCPGCCFRLSSKIITCSTKTLGRLKRGTLNSVLLLWFQGISFAMAVVSPHGARPGDLSADHQALLRCLRRVLVSTEICTFPVHIYHPSWVARWRVGVVVGSSVFFFHPHHQLFQLSKGRVKTHSLITGTYWLMKLGSRGVSFDS